MDSPACGPARFELERHIRPALRSRVPLCDLCQREQALLWFTFCSNCRHGELGDTETELLERANRNAQGQPANAIWMCLICDEVRVLWRPCVRCANRC